MWGRFVEEVLERVGGLLLLGAIAFLTPVSDFWSRRLFERF